jgi:hypothetical protein
MTDKIFPLSPAGRAIHNFGGSPLERLIVGIGEHFAITDAAKAIRRILVEEVPGKEHPSWREIRAFLRQRGNRAWLFPKELEQLGFPPALAKEAVGWQEPGYMDCFTLNDARAWSRQTKGKPLDQVLQEPEPEIGVKAGGK